MSQLKAATGAVLASHSGDWQLTNPHYATALLYGSDHAATPPRLFHQKPSVSVDRTNRDPPIGRPSEPIAGTSCLLACVDGGVKQMSVEWSLGGRG